MKIDERDKVNLTLVKDEQVKMFFHKYKNLYPEFLETQILKAIDGSYGTIRYPETYERLSVRNDIENIDDELKFTSDLAGLLRVRRQIPYAFSSTVRFLIVSQGFGKGYIREAFQSISRIHDFGFTKVKDTLDMFQDYHKLKTGEDINFYNKYTYITGKSRRKVYVKKSDTSNSVNDLFENNEKHSLPESLKTISTDNLQDELKQSSIEAKKEALYVLLDVLKNSTNQSHRLRAADIILGSTN